MFVSSTVALFLFSNGKQSHNHIMQSLTQMPCLMRYILFSYPLQCQPNLSSFHGLITSLGIKQYPVQT